MTIMGHGQFLRLQAARTIRPMDRTPTKRDASATFFIVLALIIGGYFVAQLIRGAM
jgi:hypothetical protein